MLQAGKWNGSLKESSGILEINLTQGGGVGGNMAERRTAELQSLLESALQFCQICRLGQEITFLRLGVPIYKMRRKVSTMRSCEYIPDSWWKLLREWQQLFLKI